MAIIGLKPKKIVERKGQAMTEAEAQVLEDWEQGELRAKRTRRAIQDTYSSTFTSKGRKGREARTQSTPFTKKRRQLPGKRKWKNKDEQYAKLEGQMTAQNFNRRQQAMRVLDKVYKRQHAQRQKHSLINE